ncbi:MAG: sigma-54-dependent Fis family transcriptional regulator, partial [Deltaproteobacteria bacterium]|nr:sigma-54-dependent Fis family transcriptional regulator [Deltaproteobacteria bacterium]
EKLNCAAVPEGLIESELFGHEAGAFTGATKRRRGKFERAHGGTLFLDEVGDMPPQMQAKLLRVLQEGEVERVGAASTVEVDVRVVAATNKSLEAEIEAGRFRADLFDRLNVVPLKVPALAEHVQDVPMLAEHFLSLACEMHERPGKKISEGAMRLLQAYPYPGNVRELRNLVERLVILTPDETITATEARALLPIDPGGSSGSYFRPETPLREMVEAVERDLITRALEFRDGHVTKTATDLGLERSHLYKKMRALGIRKREAD